MTFTTITFLIFYILFFVGYWWFCGKSKLLRNSFILLGSYIFYGWWDWRFLGLLFFSSMVDYTVGLAMASSNNPIRRKGLLVLSIVINLSILGFFKYCDFFIVSANDLIHAMGYKGSIATLQIILPVGISFYTFQSLSYGIDVYKSKLEPTRNVIDFLAYVAFFPQLVAGPIERASHLLPQLKLERKFDFSMAKSGLELMLWGFFKKLVIADNAAIIADKFFANPDHFDSFSTWAGLLAFAIQIYCDFSGYSDIARGCARTLGFDLMINFKTPYLSKTFTEFWNRWHISLSNWFRDYVFIPLGGNKRGYLRYLINIMITFILSGFWHGAKYTFLLWGLLHGFILVVEKIILRKWPKWHWTPIFVFMVVVICWIPFRASDLPSMMLITQKLFRFGVESTEMLIQMNIKTISWLFLLVIFGAFEIKLGLTPLEQYLAGLRRPFRWAIYYLMLFLILVFSNFNNAPSFIYFQF